MQLNRRILLAPAVKDDDQTGAEYMNPPSRLTDAWINNLKAGFEPPAEQTPPATPTKEPNASPDNPPKRPDATPVDAGKLGAGAAAPAAGTAPAAEPTKGADGKPVAATAAEDDEAQPRTGKDWEVFKGRRKEERQKFQKELEARDAKLKELEARAAELEAKASATTAVDPAITAELEAQKALVKEMGDRIAVLDVTKDPRFEAYYNGETEKAINRAKGVVGEEKAAGLEKILRLPDGDYKKAQLEEFLGDLDSDYAKARVAVVVDELDKINTEKQAEIGKANTHKEKLVAERKSTVDNARKVIEQTFVEQVKAKSDPKNGFAVFQKRDGDEAWNAQVDKRLGDAKAMLLNSKPDAKLWVNAALDSVAMPAILKAYGDDYQSWQAERAKFEAQIKELTAAQPGGGSGGTAKGTEEESGIAPPGTPPNERSKHFAASMAKAMTDGFVMK